MLGAHPVLLDESQPSDLESDALPLRHTPVTTQYCAYKIWCRNEQAKNSRRTPWTRGAAACPFDFRVRAATPHVPNGKQRNGCLLASVPLFLQSQLTTAGLDMAATMKSHKRYVSCIACCCCTNFYTNVCFSQLTTTPGVTGEACTRRCRCMGAIR